MNIDPVAKLRDWGNQLGAVEDLGAAFEQFRDELAQSDLTIWSKQVSGKYVLRTLHQGFPDRFFSLNRYLNLCMYICTTPPSDLVQMIDKIVADATP